MRILQIFNRYLYVGGEEFAVRQIGARLSTRHEVRDLWFESGDWAKEPGVYQRLRQGMRMIRNPEALSRVDQEILDFRPDVILLHNLMPVGSSALYYRLVRQPVPVVQFIHNFRPFSVNGYCWANGRIEARGLKKNFLPEVMAGAWQESRLRTAWYALQLRGLHALGVFSRIDGWIAISEFMASTFAEAGISPDRIATMPHAWTPVGELANDFEGGGEPSFLFLGRLSEEKGIRVLLDAWALHEEAGRPGRLVVAGGGPLAEEVEKRCEALKRAEWASFVEGEEKLRLLKECRAMVVPSIWWEPLGLVTFEAYDFGKPVIAARSGGIVDNVVHGKTGWLHEPGDARMLAEHLTEAAAQPERCEQLGREGRLLLEERSDEAWLKQFESFVGPLVAKSVRPVGAGRASGLTGSELSVLAYLADQNPKLGRSLGISRMTEVVLGSIGERDDVRLGTMISASSVQGPASASSVTRVPWATRSVFMRVVTDNLHPLLCHPARRPDIWYFPKGFMPRLQVGCRPAVATIHDTIIQYYQDHYPQWRLEAEYSYWAGMLKNTLTHAAAVMTVSKHAKGQIEDFIQRHGLPEREIHVTYEPCLYESIPQPEKPAKADYVLHLGSIEPHKRTAWLVSTWAEAVRSGRKLPELHVVGKLPGEVEDLVQETRGIVYLPFLENRALVSQFTAARALVFPSEVEGFGLPAIEAYYLGTPVCYTADTSIEEVLAPATTKGGFDLERPETLWAALDEALSMAPEEVRNCGLKLREEYNSKRVVERMMAVFRSVSGKSKS